MLFRRQILFSAVLAFLLLSFRAGAHEPFDCSVKMTLGVDHIAAVVTLGRDGARRIVSAAGMSSNEVTAAVRPRGPRSFVDLPRTMAAQFLELKSGEETLTADTVNTLSDGVEVIFTLIYPQPKSKMLQVRFNLYDAIPELRNGSLIAYDEGGKQLSAALLSRANVVMHIPVPEIEVASAAVVSNTSTQAASETDKTVLPIPQPPAIQPSFRRFGPLGITLAVVGLVAAMAGFGKLRLIFFR